MIASQAARIKVKSGSLVLRRGVGTQIMIASHADSLENCVVGANRPPETISRIVGELTSAMWLRPDASAFTLAASTSNPTTRNPFWAKAAARGSPTYPSPTIPTTAFREAIFADKPFFDILGF